MFGSQLLVTPLRHDPRSRTLGFDGRVRFVDASRAVRLAPPRKQDVEVGSREVHGFVEASRIQPVRIHTPRLSIKLSSITHLTCKLLLV
jgi:hypothetical protein